MKKNKMILICLFLVLYFPIVLFSHPTYTTLVYYNLPVLTFCIFSSGLIRFFLFKKYIENIKDFIYKLILAAFFEIVLLIFSFYVGGLLPDVFSSVISIIIFYLFLVFGINFVILKKYFEIKNKIFYTFYFTFIFPLVLIIFYTVLDILRK